jgi:hypothetical protein
MPFGHLMFENPVGYGMIDLGEQSVERRREALENSVRAMLDGWDRNVDSETLQAIVNACVERKLAGEDTGSSPFMLCLAAGA